MWYIQKYTYNNCSEMSFSLFVCTKTDVSRAYSTSPDPHTSPDPLDGFKGAAMRQECCCEGMKGMMRGGQRGRWGRKMGRDRKGEW